MRTKVRSCFLVAASVPVGMSVGCGIGWAKVLKAAAAVMTGAAGGGGDGLTPDGTIEGSDFIAFANSCAADG